MGVETGQKVPFVYIKYKILDRFLASEYTVWAEAEL